MNRHAYSNGNSGAYPLGGRGAFSIQPHKYAYMVLVIDEAYVTDPAHL